MAGLDASLSFLSFAKVFSEWGGGGEIGISCQPPMLWSSRSQPAPSRDYKFSTAYSFYHAFELGLIHSSVGDRRDIITKNVFFDVEGLVVFPVRSP